MRGLVAASVAWLTPAVLALALPSSPDLQCQGAQLRSLVKVAAVSQQPSGIRIVHIEPSLCCCSSGGADACGS